MNVRRWSVLVLMAVSAIIYVVIDGFISFNDGRTLDKKAAIQKIICDGYEWGVANAKVRCFVSFRAHGHVITVSAENIDLCSEVDVGRFRQHLKYVKPKFTWGWVWLKFQNVRVNPAPKIVNGWTLKPYLVTTCYSALIL